jgi:hypothetical protein
LNIDITVSFDQIGSWLFPMLFGESYATWIEGFYLALDHFSEIILDCLVDQTRKECFKLLKALLKVADPDGLKGLVLLGAL